MAKESLIRSKLNKHSAAKLNIGSDKSLYV